MGLVLSFLLLLRVPELFVKDGGRVSARYITREGNIFRFSERTTRWEGVEWERPIK